MPEPQDVSSFRESLEIGPDQPSLLACRPYFLIDLDIPRDQWPTVNGVQRDPAELVAERIVGKLDTIRTAPDFKPITDIYVSIHGWHRNMYAGVRAYDRLGARFSALLRRGRLTPAPPNYSPLHINLHWNSDITADDWVDVSGRKSRESFIEKGLDVFEQDTANPDRGVLVSFLEDAYAYFTASSAPDIDPRDLDRQGELFKRACGFRLIDAPNATDPEVMCALWTCYHESDPLSPTEEQRDQPSSYVRNRFKQGLSFLMRAVAIGSLIGIFAGPTKQLATSLNTYVTGQVDGFLTGTVGTPDSQMWIAEPAGLVVAYGALYAVLFAICIGLLTRRRAKVQGSLRARRRADRTQRAAAGTTHHAEMMTRIRAARENKRNPMPVWGIFAWAVAQVGPLFLVLLLCMLSYPSMWFLLPAWAGLGALGVVPQIQGILPPVSDWLKSAPDGLPWVLNAMLIVPVIWVVAYLFQVFSTTLAFDERAGQRGQAPDPKQLAKRISRIRRSFMGFASWPSKLAAAGDVPESKVYGLWDTVQSQLAIVEMQMKAVEMSFVAAGAVDRIAEAKERNPGLFAPTVRVHLFGHSFGGLLAVNLAKQIAWKGDVVARCGLDLHTVCTLQGAYASDWFVQEEATLAKITGCVAAIYSKYDTATGAMYSIANAARFGCGCIGFSKERKIPGPFGGKPIPAKFTTYAPLPSASLSNPPDLVERCTLANVLTPARSANGACPVLNVDCSRFIFEGPTLKGGAHDDIFRLDTIYTTFGVAHADFFSSAPLAPTAAINAPQTTALLTSPTQPNPKSGGPQNHP